MPEAAPRPAAALPSGLRDRRIHVVEDEYIMAQDLRYELEDAGAEVLGPVPSVTGALTLLAREAPPDAAILDVNLGGEMVYPLADILRQRGIPFMFATGLRPAGPAARICHGAPLRKALHRAGLPQGPVRLTDRHRPSVSPA